MAELKEYTIDIGGKEYLITSDDNYAKHHAQSSFEPHMVKLFRTLNNDSKVILDVGANVGLTAILFSTLAEQVYAFEPSKTTAALLTTNVGRLETNNVSVQNMGLGTESFESTITFAKTDRSGGFVSNQLQVGEGHTTETIQIEPLDQVVQALGIEQVDFIKIDVEGFEPHVLRGAKETLQTHKPVVVLELNHWCLNAFQRTSIPEFFDLLRSIFPILFAVDNQYYLDLNNEDERYMIMYHHIIMNHFQNIVAGFDESQLMQFRSQYTHGFELPKHAAPNPGRIRSFVNRAMNRLNL